MNIHALYKNWTEMPLDDPDLGAELQEICGKDTEIEDRFYRYLSFGTGGLRGVIGAGTNRMNIYTIRYASQGVANYIKTLPATPSVVIAYDSRNKSELFAREAAKTYAANGIKTYLFNQLMPTPVLSFAVRHLACTMGIVITASHNPAEYNGYKVYDDNGCQITDDTANRVLSEINALDFFGDPKSLDFDTALQNEQIVYLDKHVLDAFLQAVQSQSVHPNLGAVSNLKMVYSPLNGAGNIPVRRILEKNGFDPIIVCEQELPDGNFTTCPYPNPEEKEALTRAIELAKQQDADLLIATDPDCDRIGVALKSADGYRILSGNETGLLILTYLLETRNNLPDGAISVKTIVTSDMVYAIAKKHDIGVVEVLTGFKYIGEVIGRLETLGQRERFIFGFEESCGYLAGTHARDKDAVVAAMLMSELAAYYKMQGKSVLDVLNALYDEFGYYVTRLVSVELKGKEGAEKIQSIMALLRADTPSTIGNATVTAFYDYQKEVALPQSVNSTIGITLPPANVLTFETDRQVKLIIRPSGTEPKIKIYYMAVAKNKAQGEQAIDLIAQAFSKYFT